MSASILLVEDDVDVRFILEHVLAAAGFQVVSVETVASAVKLVTSRPFDLVVSDGMLVDGMGTTVADRAAEHATKTLIVTGNAFSLPNLDKYEYALKPIRPSELIAVIHRLLRPRDDESEILLFPKSGH